MTTYVVSFTFRRIHKIAITTATDEREAWLNIIKLYARETKWLKLSFTIPYYKEVQETLVIEQHPVASKTK